MLLSIFVNYMFEEFFIQATTFLKMSVNQVNFKGTNSLFYSRTTIFSYIFWNLL